MYISSHVRTTFPVKIKFEWLLSLVIYQIKFPVQKIEPYSKLIYQTEDKQTEKWQVRCLKNSDRNILWNSLQWIELLALHIFPNSWVKYAAFVQVKFWETRITSDKNEVLVYEFIQFCFILFPICQTYSNDKGDCLKEIAIFQGVSIAIIQTCLFYLTPLKNLETNTEQKVRMLFSPTE